MQVKLLLVAFAFSNLTIHTQVHSQSTEVVKASRDSQVFPEPYNSEPETTSPMLAEEAAATAVLPPGFRCEVFASEPDVQQPIAMCFDGRGRLWVAECYTYAEQPDRWTDDLRDRIIILEDTTGDGRADQALR